MFIEFSSIHGLKIVRDIEVVDDNRGSFRTWWRADWADADVAGIDIRQANLTFNSHRGTTRGSHVAPWDKYTHVFTGSVLAVIIDARLDSGSFGDVASFVLDETDALFIPRGCGHAYQTIVDNVAYGHAVNELWFHDNQEIAISLFDRRFTKTPWPIANSQDWIMSQKDRESQFFDDVFSV